MPQSRRASIGRPGLGSNCKSYQPLGDKRQGYTMPVDVSTPSGFQYMAKAIWCNGLLLSALWATIGFGGDNNGNTCEDMFAAGPTAARSANSCLRQAPGSTATRPVKSCLRQCQQRQNLRNHSCYRVNSGELCEVVLSPWPTAAKSLKSSCQQGQ